MTRIKRPAAAVGAAVLLALSLSACGGAPTDASKDDFCEAVNDQSAFEDVDPEDTEAYVDALKEQAESLEEVGTPDDISDDAREGFEIYVDTIGDIDADDIDNPEDLEDEISKDDEKKVEEFFTYQGETCTPEVPDVEDLEIPTDGATE
jgi:hypothetical protein